ncbi:MAG: hypothetical protein JNK82_37530 [Myxococcaceae bacterium]|nr:hypothetical protein [Myxococcaceae bacterium]
MSRKQKIYALLGFFSLMAWLIATVAMSSGRDFEPNAIAFLFGVAVFALGHELYRRFG